MSVLRCHVCGSRLGVRVMPGREEMCCTRDECEAATYGYITIAYAREKLRRQGHSLRYAPRER